VLRNTGNRQEPYVYGSLGGDDVPLVPAKPAAVAPTPNSNAEVRRDYELALQIGTREVWTAFLAQYPGGLYATLATGQLNKIALEEARIAATEKARLAEEEKARLRAEGAKQAEQAKAAAQAKAAEDARLAAEKAKQIQQEKVAAAEQARAAAEKLATEKAEAASAAAAKAASEKVDAEKSPTDAVKSEQQVASLPPTDSSAPSTALSAADIARSIQVELRRVGCLTGSVDGEWTPTSRRALELFNQNAGTKFDVTVASVDTLDVIKAKPARICPLICKHGFKVDGERCTGITCRPGYELGDDNNCDKIEVKKSKREELKAQRGRSELTRAASKPAGPPSTESPQAKFANSPTCTNVRLACEQSRSKHGLGAGHCASSFAQCMQTGKWKSSYSDYEGLARR